MVLGERIHECIPKDKTIHTLYYKQAVYRRCTKMTRGLLDDCWLCRSQKQRLYCSKNKGKIWSSRGF